MEQEILAALREINETLKQIKGEISEATEAIREIGLEEEEGEE